MPPSGCPPWPSDQPGHAGMRGTLPSLSYTTARDTIQNSALPTPFREEQKIKPLSADRKSGSGRSSGSFTRYAS